MNKLLLILIALLPLAGFGQNEFYNGGSTVYVQKGSLISIQGSLTNANALSGANGAIKNDGTIEIQGDFNNVSGANFGVNTDNTSKERVVKFMGTGAQAITGTMNSQGSASFYNLVIDKGNATDVVTMHTDVAVEGSLVFGTSNTTGTYNPSNLYTNNNQKGLIQTYNGSTEYALNVLNGNTDAIAGYPAMVMNAAPTTGYVLTSGTRGTANGGLQRQIASAVAYDYPVGTTAHGFNAVRMNFSSIPAGGGLVKGKFNDGSDNPSGAIGSMSQECIGCTATNPSPDNTGYNRYFSSNPCNGSVPQWLVLEDAVQNHGYWSFASADNNQNYSYFLEAFANSYTMLGSTTDTWRTLKYGGTYGFNPSGSAVNWTSYVDSIYAATDLLEYSLNTGSCYTGAGVPGGTYSGFGHFSMKKSKSGNALPVKLLILTATPANQVINVAWSTALEINNSGFDVERSADGVSFTKIGFVEGHNNSTVQQNYTFVDNKVSDNVIYYYRLRQVDNNGNSEESYIVSAEVMGGTDFAIGEPMPNPASESSKIVVTSGVSRQIGVRVYNMVGQLISNESMTVNAGSGTIPLDLQHLASGNYSAVIDAEGKSFTKIFVVSK